MIVHTGATVQTSGEILTVNLKLSGRGRILIVIAAILLFLICTESSEVTSTRNRFFSCAKSILHLENPSGIAVSSATTICLKGYNEY